MKGRGFNDSRDVKERAASKKIFLKKDLTE